MDCTEYNSTIPRRDAPEVFKSHSPRKKRAQGMPGARCTGGLVCRRVARRTRRIFSDENVVQKWLDVEAALAKVQAELGVIPEEAAAEIRRKSGIEYYDLDAMKQEMDRTSHPIVPLLSVIKDVCEGDAGEYVHWGTTTQTSWTLTRCSRFARPWTRSSPIFGK